MCDEDSRTTCATLCVCHSVCCMQSVFDTYGASGLERERLLFLVIGCYNNLVSSSTRSSGSSSSTSSSSSSSSSMIASIGRSSFESSTSSSSLFLQCLAK